MVAIGTGGRNIKPRPMPPKHIFGYAVGLDMTRRDLQARPEAGPPVVHRQGLRGIGAHRPDPPGSSGVGPDTEIVLEVNGATRQKSTIAGPDLERGRDHRAPQAAWTLAPGDLIFTGTPEGVAAVVAGDMPAARVTGGFAAVQVVAL